MKICDLNFNSKHPKSTFLLRLSLTFFNLKKQTIFHLTFQKKTENLHNFETCNLQLETLSLLIK